jgi:hypothetical protein
MKTKLLAVTVALLLVGTGAAAAMPGNALDGVPADDEQSDAADTRRGPPEDAGNGVTGSAL